MVFFYKGLYFIIKTKVKCIYYLFKIKKYYESKEYICNRIILKKINESFRQPSQTTIKPKINITFILSFKAVLWSGKIQIYAILRNCIKNNQRLLVLVVQLKQNSTRYLLLILIISSFTKYYKKYVQKTALLKGTTLYKKTKDYRIIETTSFFGKRFVWILLVCPF